MAGGPNPPAPPQPSAIASDQQAQNVITANNSMRTNEVGQQDPYGALTWQQSVDPTTGVLTSTANQSYSPAQQALLQFQQAMGGLGGATGTKLLATLAPGLSQAPNLEGNANSLTEQFQRGVMPLFEEFAQPQLAQQDTQLRNSGIMPVNQDGTPNPAYWQSLNQLATAQGNQVNSNIAQFQPQAFSEALGQYTAPQSWLQSMFNWSTPAALNQQYATPPSVNYQAPNMNDAYNTYINQAQRRYTASNEGFNNMMSGLMKMGSSAIGALAMA